MANRIADVALLTERRYAGSVAKPDDWYFANILRDDAFLQSALEQFGLSSVRVDWANPDVDWSRFRCAVFRTTWDYFDRFAEFAAWLGRVQTQTRLCNDSALVWWNLDKHYLADLEARGIPVVSSRFVERGCETPLRDLLDEAGWDRAVIKPCVSGAARHTYRIDRENADRIQEIVAPLLAAESFLLQPFVQSVVDCGEDTLMIVDGRFTHAVRKIAKAGDFRVQDDHGGSAHVHEPTAAQIELAERAMSTCRPVPAYGRVDMVRDDAGRWAVMELELIEPELWLRNFPPAATAFARAIAEASRQ